MNTHRDSAYRVLERLLTHGLLTAVPKRPADQHLLVAMAASLFEARRSYSEAEVNEALKRWLATISEPFGIDHVTMRRMLVDSRLLGRTSSGASYHVNASRLEEIDAVRGIDVPALLVRIRAERERRKQRHAH